MLEPQCCKFQGIVPRTKPTQTPETEKGPISKRERNVGGNVGETGSSLESLWDGVVLGLLLAPRPDTRKHFMETP